MIRVVLDTNVYISALMFGGLPGSLLDLAFLQSFVLVASPALLDELDEKLRLKFEVPSEDAAMIRAKLESTAEIVRPDMVLNVITDDPDDDRVLECAVNGHVDYIVTGDRHLLKLSTYEAIPIITVREFLDAVEMEDGE
jgi:putative PIN family toxin of toxin-antitoxin system